jgi:hypothetical protein
MEHLPGFWDDANWDDAKWAEFLRRAEKKGRAREWLDQLLHRCMGRWCSREWWEARERTQWPSGTGAYDPCIDHYNWLLGAKCYDEASALRESALERRPEWVEYG